MSEEYRIPLRLPVSRTPLVIRVEISQNFPVSPPIVQVLARVLHSDIDSKSKTYLG
jgi:ubiquitin-protein ligase